MESKTGDWKSTIIGVGTKSKRNKIDYFECNRKGKELCRNNLQIEEPMLKDSEQKIKCKGGV